MTIDEKWRDKNLLLRKKERINILERITVMANKEIEIVNEETCKFLWNRKKNESFLECILSHAFMILLSLDKVIGFYYMKFRIHMNLKKYKKELNKLKKEIQIYESN
jgi:hypothetical protein